VFQVKRRGVNKPSHADGTYDPNDEKDCVLCGGSAIACHGKKLKYTASVTQPPQKVYFWENGRVGRSFLVSRLGNRGSDFTLVVRIVSSCRSPIKPVDIPAVVDLAQIVKVPKRQRIEVFDLRISLER
jgi:hypothetical protein